jgi:hypothetical protein
MSLLLLGVSLSAILTLGAIAISSRDDPDGFTGA